MCTGNWIDKYSLSRHFPMDAHEDNKKGSVDCSEVGAEVLDGHLVCSSVNWLGGPALASLLKDSVRAAKEDPSVPSWSPGPCFCPSRSVCQLAGRNPDPGLVTSSVTH